MTVGGAQPRVGRDRSNSCSSKSGSVRGRGSSSKKAGTCAKAHGTATAETAGKKSRWSPQEVRHCAIVHHVRRAEHRAVLRGLTVLPPWSHAWRTQDALLRNAVKQHNGKNWKRIAEYFDGRTDVQCLHRWQKVLNPNLVKGPWTPEVRPALVASARIAPVFTRWLPRTPVSSVFAMRPCVARWQEDEKVRQLVAKFGPKKWSVIAHQLPGRMGKQCRERYV